MLISEAIKALSELLENHGDVPVCYLENAGREYYAYKFPVAIAFMDIPDKPDVAICAFLSQDVVEGLEVESKALDAEFPDYILN